MDDRSKWIKQKKKSKAVWSLKGKTEHNGKWSEILVFYAVQGEGEVEECGGGNRKRIKRSGENKKEEKTKWKKFRRQQKRRKKYAIHVSSQLCQRRSSQCWQPNRQAIWLHYDTHTHSKMCTPTCMKKKCMHVHHSNMHVHSHVCNSQSGANAWRGGWMMDVKKRVRKRTHIHLERCQTCPITRGHSSRYVSNARQFRVRITSHVGDKYLCTAHHTLLQWGKALCCWCTFWSCILMCLNIIIVCSLHVTNNFSARLCSLVLMVSWKLSHLR